MKLKSLAVMLILGLMIAENEAGAGSGDGVDGRTDADDIKKEANKAELNANTLKADATKETDGKKINVDNLMNNFKVNFEVDSRINSNSTNGTIKNDRRDKKGGKVVKKDDDKKFDKLVKQVFGGGKKKHQPKRYSKQGKELKYYKDTGIPMMLRKVIPPRGPKLPNLHFEYVEGNSICRCTCNL